jgi:hypothetical protein
VRYHSLAYHGATIEHDRRAGEVNSATLLEVPISFPMHIITNLLGGSKCPAESEREAKGDSPRASSCESYALSSMPRGFNLDKGKEIAQSSSPRSSHGILVHLGRIRRGHLAGLPRSIQQDDNTVDQYGPPFPRQRPKLHEGSCRISP